MYDTFVKDTFWFMSYFKYYIHGESNLSNLEFLFGRMHDYFRY